MGGVRVGVGEPTTSTLLKADDLLASIVRLCALVDLWGVVAEVAVVRDR